VLSLLGFEYIADIFSVWYMWVLLIALIALVGLLFYLRSQKEDDD
jgi:hypothetical protein